MATLVTHSGQCCGKRVIYGFGDRHGGGNAASLLETIRTHLNNRLTIEVILSDKQTREDQPLLDELARLGFVYINSWTGQHSTPVHQFERAYQRLALDDRRFTWNGMIINSGLGGRLPDGGDENPLHDRLTPEDRELRRGLEPYNHDLRVVNIIGRNMVRVGDRVQVVSPRSRYNEQEGTVERTDWDDLYIRIEGVERLVRLVRTSVISLEDERIDADAPIDRNYRLNLPRYGCRFQDDDGAIWIYARIRGVVVGNEQGGHIATFINERTGRKADYRFHQLRFVTNRIPRGGWRIEDMERGAGDGEPPRRREYRHPNLGNNAPGGGEPTIVLTEYFARFRNGSQKGPYGSLGELRRVNPRVLNYNLRTVNSVGDVEDNIRRVADGDA